MTATSHLGVALIEQSQSQKEVTANQAFTSIDAVLNSGAKSRGLATPPGSPASGDLYIVAASPTGDWSGQAGKLTYYDQIWRFITPNHGIMLWVNDESQMVIYDGSNWTAIKATVAGNQNILDQSSNYTLSSADYGKVIRFTSASAVVLTLPNSIPASFNCSVLQAGTGQVTFTPDSGANRRNRQSHTKTAGQWAVCALLVNANSGGASAEYVLSGDTAA
jgi:hypothetical protein